MSESTGPEFDSRTLHMTACQCGHVLVAHELAGGKCTESADEDTPCTCTAYRKEVR